MLKHCAWLIVDSFISAGKVVSFCDVLKLLTDRILVCRGAHVTRILCSSIKTLLECLVEVILSYTSEFWAQGRWILGLF